MQASLRDYERWLTKAPMGRLHSLMASVPGSLLVNTPAFKLDQELQLHAENRVLDIGCGRGTLLQLLTSRLRFQKPAAGVDVSRSLLGHAQHAAPLAELAQASPAQLPFADKSFDVVTCAYMAVRLDDGELLDLLREIRRVLEYGGIALLWDFAPVGSRALNRIHKQLLQGPGEPPRLRSFTTLSAYALDAGFEWVSNAHLGPFLFPPIPRVSVVMGKAPIGWEPGDTQGLAPDTHARSLVAGVAREGPAGQSS